EGMLASARGVAIKAKPEAPKGNMVVFSAAQGDETAYPYEDKGHGLFTYFLLKKLQETKGQVSLGELAQYVQQQVSRRSIVTNGKSQTPCVTPSETVVETWKGKMLK
ncbi:caspase family protein, partial [uncultured Bacteroides sp.]|uniref:caspase family protein n=1 Tax=uncultured Bacteroides sp. TaxID=162156 RepID=UPI00260CE140